MRFVREANQALWHHHNLTCVIVNIMRYEPRDFFERHCDGNLDPDRQWVGLIASLCDPDSYVGGELQIGRRFAPTRLPLGCAVAVPGDLEHRVLPITSGERWTLAAFSATP